MAKKQRCQDGLNHGPAHNAVHNSDVLHRLNFVYQAAHFLASVANHQSHLSSLPQPCSPNPLPPSRPRKNNFKRKHRPFRSIPDKPMIGLSRNLSRSIKAMAKKSVTRIDPSLKRTICQSCGLILISGQTATVRVLASGPHAHKVSTTCLACGWVRTIPHPPRKTINDRDKVDGVNVGDKNLELNTSEEPKRAERACKHKRQERDLAFWEKPQHVTFVGHKKISGL